MGSNILSIILYGSHARNDEDDNSDYDLCVLTKARNEYGQNLKELNCILNNQKRYNVKPVFYPEPIVDLMLEHGSLFLWHLKIEGKVVFGENHFNKITKKLKPFRTHHEEIKYHEELYEDLIRSWDYYCEPNELDLSLLFTIARNTCMILSHKKGNPSFGRHSSYSTAKLLYPDLPLSIDDYLYLSNWKIVYERGGEKKYNLPNREQYTSIVSKIGELLHYANQNAR